MRVTAALKVVPIAAVAFAIAGHCSTASAVVSISGVGPRDNQTMVINHFGRPIPLDLRILGIQLEFDDPDNPSNGVRLLTIKSMSESFYLSSEMHDHCWRTRDQGIGTNPNEGAELVVQCEAWAIKQINIEGSEGGDLICTIDPANWETDVGYDIHSHSGKDSITGSANSDELNGGADGDLLRGWKGDDHLFGYEFPKDDRHNPILEDGDYLWGEQDTDNLWGGPGSDHLSGGIGNDDLCGTDAAAWVGSGEVLTATGCVDHEQRDQSNTLFSSEPLGVDLDFGTPSPAGPNPDSVKCGGDMQHATQYDTGIDVMVNCPSPISPMTTPPQYLGREPTFEQAAAATGARACPPIHEKRD